MMKPYRIVFESDEFIIYEFNPVYFYVLYIILAVMLIGIWTDIAWLSYSGIALMALYFLAVSLPYLPLHFRIRKAMRESSVELSGSKWSFSRPLTIKMKRMRQVA